MRGLLSLMLVILLSAPALAAGDGFQGPSGRSQGGFQGPTGQTNVTTVAQALKAWDDTPVTLTGNIVERVAGHDDDYIFRDATGEIVVDIDHKTFRGQTVTPETRVRISGKVDKDMLQPVTVDVKWLELL